MILIHRETAEIYEMRIKSIIHPLENGSFHGGYNSRPIYLTYEIEEIVLVGKRPVNLRHDDIPYNFEILGWL